MTEIERAIETLKHLSLCGTCTAGECTDCERYRAKKLALSAMEKQIPKKPIIPEKTVDIEISEMAIMRGVRIPICQCDRQVIYYDKYCRSCGQALDWSGE